LSRFRKVDTRLHLDANVRQLSRPLPNGLSLWMHLLTTVNTCAIPGLFRASAEQLAGELGWPLDGFLDAFREFGVTVGGTVRATVPGTVPGTLSATLHGTHPGTMPTRVAKPMAKLDLDAHLVWLPNALKYDPPANPNTLIAWKKAWAELPECLLKDEAGRALTAYLAGCGRSFTKPYVNCFGNGSSNGTGNGSPNGTRNQDSGSRIQEAGVEAEAQKLFPLGEKVHPLPSTTGRKQLPAAAAAKSSHLKDVPAAEALKFFRWMQESKRERWGPEVAEEQHPPPGFDGWFDSSRAELGEEKQRGTWLSWLEDEEWAATRKPAFSAQAFLGKWRSHIPEKLKSPSPARKDPKHGAPPIGRVKAGVSRG
jgi:hypothetical protein